jgi:tetratricopeptide (TPR) repeat protein
LDPRWAATCYLKLGDYGRARSIYLDVLKLAPDDPTIAAGLGEVYLFSGDPRKAEEWGAKLADRPEPKYQVVGRLLRAFALAFENKRDDAAKELAWIGQLLLSVGTIQDDAWDYRDLQSLIARMGPNAGTASLLLDVLTKKTSPTDFARAWNQPVDASR